MRERREILIEKVVGLLEDGCWHTLRDIEEDLNVSEADLQRIVSFLEEYGFLNVESKKVKLAPSFLQLPT